MSEFLLQKLVEEAQVSINAEEKIKRQARNKKKAERRARRGKGKITKKIVVEKG